MDVTKYKCPHDLHHHINDACIYLSVLPTNKIKSAEQVAHRACARDKKYLNLEVAIQIVAASAGVEPREVRCYYPDDVYSAWRAWLSHQSDCTPDIDELKGYISWAVYEIDEISIDGMYIYNTSGPSEYYGKPAIDITVGQMIYYLLLRRAYTDRVENSQKVTKQWIKKMRMKHEREHGITNQNRGQ